MVPPPLISALMPVFNVEAYVAQAIESVLQQTMQDFELIVINDGCTDDTPAIVERYARRDAPREARLMVARGALPLPPIELATVLFALLHDPDAEVKSTARDSLEKLPASVIDPVLTGPAHPALLSHFSFVFSNDEAALEKARRGVYQQNSLRAVTRPQLDRHFTADGTGVKVKESIRKLVSFRSGNLLEPESFDGLAPLDALFCRNVLIYFSDEAIQRAVALFHEVLAPGGYLFLGHAESLSRVTSAFTPIRFQGAIVYQRPEGQPS